MNVSEEGMNISSSGGGVAGGRESRLFSSSVGARLKFVISRGQRKLLNLIKLSEACSGRIFGSEQIRIQYLTALMTPTKPHELHILWDE
jgi:hypothetical protein